MTTLYLCGAGNSAGVRLALTVQHHQHAWDQIVLLDDDPRKQGQALLDVPIVGPLSLLAAAPPGSQAVNLVARTTAGRAAVHRRIATTGVPFVNLVHPGVAAGDCVLGDGVLVYEQAVLSPETRLGDGACVFLRAVVGHEATVGAGCVLAAGSVLNARVVLGEQVYVGSNASVLPEIRVGSHATVGANTMVAMDVPAGASIVGVPGQILAAAPAAPGPAPAAPAAPTAPAANGPVASLEARLLALLHTVLGHADAGPTDRFFDVGGTSLRAIQLVAAMRQHLGIDLPLVVLYSRCTMRELALHLAGAGSTATAVQQARSRVLARRRWSGASGEPRLA
jgi:sugar O-acyltransferase (sialic acid O-acetyltransferase NeuD family)